MTVIKTSNELTEIHGRPPTDEMDASKIDRGFVIYLEVVGENGLLFARTFWTRYGEYEHEGRTHVGPADQRAFVSSILKHAPNGGLRKLVPDKQNPYTENNPVYFTKDISRIDFGWKPIYVSYVLNNEHIKFQKLDPKNIQKQPLVFRKNKMVNGSEENYLKNYSFFNLKDYDEGNASILEFSNHMIVDDRGTYIGDRPPHVDPKDLPEYPYCLDIMMDFPQDPLLNALAAISSVYNPKLIDDSERNGDFLNAITFVFDPPQGNGGGGGPPDYP